MLNKDSARAARPRRFSPVRAEALECRQLMSITWNTVGVSSVNTRNTVTLDHAYSGNSDQYVDLQTQPDQTQFPMGMYAVQDRGVYGANTQLAAAGTYSVKYHYDVWTWDSYSDPTNDPNKGYYDAFSVSLSPTAYTESAAQPNGSASPKTLPTGANVWGGETYNDVLEGPTWGLEHLVGDGSLSYSNPDPTQALYLNVVVDTASANQDPSGSLPSWGQIQITGINTTPSVSVSQSSGQLTFTRDQGLSSDLTVYYHLDGNAALGTDYTLSGDTGDATDPTLRYLTIASGQASATVDLTSTGAHPGTTVSATVVANPGDASGSTSYFMNGDPAGWTS